MRKTAGLTHITIFTEPAPCGGKCIYCPSVPEMPKSYLPHADIKKFGLNYSSREQLRYWISKTIDDGMAAKKIEVIILGGSFLAHSRNYRREFIRGIYEAIDGDAPNSTAEEIIERHSSSAERRIIGITIEARPDQIDKASLEEIFRLGVTKVELGVQSLNDEILEFNKRGHSSKDVESAVAVTRDFGLKVGFHLLLGMPGSNFEKDIVSSERALKDSRFRPDHIKFYFCEMFKKEFMDPELRKLFEEGKWKPLDKREREALLEVILPMVPESTRISRIGRKCADSEVEGERFFIDRGNVERKFKCRCIRCREPLPKFETDMKSVIVADEKWRENEVYFEARPESENRCLGLLRLHINSTRSIVRELHVYGIETPTGEHGIHQHKGIGKMLLKAAEDYSKRFGCKIIFVASGVGVREYYRKKGYILNEDGFMEKEL